MQKMDISFSPPDISDLEIQYVTDVLRSGWITTGPKTKELEKKIAEWTGTPKAVCLSSCTAALEIVLRILGVGEGDEVITSSYTYTASASVVCHVGATLKLIDIQKSDPENDSGTIEMDYDAVEAAITEKTKVIIPVDLGGIPCDYDKIFEIVEKKKHLFLPANEIQEKIGRVVVLSDSAHAFGAEWHGKAVGSIADFSAFSFHAVKNLTTAEGGAFTWKHIDGIDDEEIYQKAMQLSLHGQSKDAMEKMNGSWEYDIIGTWYKCNMTDISAAMGLAQIERYPGILNRRKCIIEQYDKAFKPLGVKVLKHYTINYSSSGHLYITNIPGITSKQRDNIIIQMAERGIACNVHYKPLPMYTAYKEMGFDINDYPNAYERFENEITLPLYTKLSDEEVKYVIRNYLDVLKEYIKKRC